MSGYQTWLLEWFQYHAPQVPLGPDDNFFLLGAIDSLGVIELIEDLEQDFSIRFSQEDFQDRRFTSIKGLAELLKEKENSETTL